MDFRNLLNKLDVLSEGLTLSSLVAYISGYEQDNSIRYPMIAKLAKQNGFEGLVDPVTGNYIEANGSTDVDDEDEVPFEAAEKLSAAGLLPPNAKLPQAGWFDDDRVYKAAGAHLTTQSQAAAEKQNLRTHRLAEYVRLKRAIRDKILNLQQRGVQLPPEALSFLQDYDAHKAPVYGRQDTPNNYSTPPAPPPSLGSDSMNNIAKNKITPNVPSLAESIVLSMNEDFDWEAAKAAGLGAYNGATFGLGPDINAGVKSLVKGTSYKDEVPAEIARFQNADKNYPRAYTGGNVAGSIVGPGKFLGLGKGIAAGAAAYGGQAALRGGYGVETPEIGADAQPSNLEQASQEVQMFQSAINQQYGDQIPEDGEFNEQTVQAIRQHILQKYGAQK